MSHVNRRKFVGNISLVVGSALLAGASGKTLLSHKNLDKKLGIALVGLGSYSTYQLAPALVET